MVTAHQKIERWGKGLGLRLPPQISEALGLQVDQRVSISIESQSMIITPYEPAPLSLADRLAQFDPAKRSGEIHSGVFSDAAD